LVDIINPLAARPYQLHPVGKFALTLAERDVAAAIIDIHNNYRQEHYENVYSVSAYWRREFWNELICEDLP
jgi:hypothetical protein